MVERLAVNQDVADSSSASGAKISESYNGSTAVSKTVSVGSIPTSGAKMGLLGLVTQSKEQTKLKDYKNPQTRLWRKL